MIDTLLHRWLRLPYLLHGEVVKRGASARQTVLFIHGIGNSGTAWQEVIDQLPPNVRVITIDLLGFGKSPRPSWATYDAKTQAKAIHRTCLLRGIFGNVLVVGHSMGSLVAIELARRHPSFVRSLILCSPPLYRAEGGSLKGFPSTETMLRALYKAAQQKPDQFVKLSAIAMKYGLINRAFNVTDENIDSYMAALEAAIVNQTALEDVTKLTMPIHIIRGTLDPVIVPKRIKALAKAQSNVTVSSIIAGHEVRGRFVKKVVEMVTVSLRSQ